MDMVSSAVCASMLVLALPSVFLDNTYQPRCTKFKQANDVMLRVKHQTVGTVIFLLGSYFKTIRPCRQRLNHDYSFAIIIKNLFFISSLAISQCQVKSMVPISIVGIVISNHVAHSFVVFLFFCQPPRF